MADEPQKPTVRLLREIRAEQQTMRADIADMREQVRDLVQRVDGNTLVFNLVAGVVHDHEHRIDRLEWAE